jgi:hypothetical protein
MKRQKGKRQPHGTSGERVDEVLPFLPVCGEFDPALVRARVTRCIEAVDSAKRLEVIPAKETLARLTRLADALWEVLEAKRDTNLALLGALKACTSQPCGLMPDITCLMTPSLPAASMPCSTMSTAHRPFA